jgi:hypothetical protein
LFHPRINDHKEVQESTRLGSDDGRLDDDLFAMARADEDLALGWLGSGGERKKGARHERQCSKPAPHLAFRFRPAYNARSDTFTANRKR